MAQPRTQTRISRRPQPVHVLSHRQKTRVQFRRHAPPLQAGAGRAPHTWPRLTFWHPPPLTSLAVPMAQPRTQTRISLRPQPVHVLQPQAENASPVPAACTSTAGGSRSCRAHMAQADFVVTPHPSPAWQCPWHSRGFSRARCSNVLLLYPFRASSLRCVIESISIDLVQALTHITQLSRYLPRDSESS